jgi:hypothetical protein
MREPDPARPPKAKGDGARALAAPRHQPPSQAQRRRVEPRGPVARAVAAGLAPSAHAELRAGQTKQLELAVVRVAARLVTDPSDRHADPLGGGEQRALDGTARSGHGRAQPERSVAADLVERERPVEASPAAAGAHPAGERQGAEVVRRARVDPLLGAGGHEPDVAGRPDALEPAGQLGDHADTRGVVVGARSVRGRVRVRHDDPQAGGIRVTDPDHIAGAAAPGHLEGLDPHAQPRPLEGPRDEPVGACLRRARRRPRPPGGEPRGDLIGAGGHLDGVRRPSGQRPGGGRRGQHDRGRHHASSFSSSSGSVTGRWQAKCSQT